jgi:hypothetical protein
MGGFVSIMAHCFSCGTLFMSNPHSVPSYDNQPICRSCIAIVNERRAASGLPLWPVADDAYDAADETQL